MPPGQLQANLWQSADIFIGSCSQCTGLISTNPCHQINHHLGFFFFAPQMYSFKCLRQRDVGEKAFDSVVTGAPQHPAWLCLFWWAMMKAQVDVRKLPLLRTPHLWFPISTRVEVCSLAAGHSGSVLTKLCLFPGLQGSQGKLGSRGETNKKAPLSHTLKSLSNTFVFYTQRGTFLFWGEEL